MGARILKSLYVTARGTKPITRKRAQRLNGLKIKINVQDEVSQSQKLNMI